MKDTRVQKVQLEVLESPVHCPLYRRNCMLDDLIVGHIQSTEPLAAISRVCQPTRSQPEAPLWMLCYDVGKLVRSKRCQPQAGDETSFADLLRNLSITNNSQRGEEEETTRQRRKKKNPSNNNQKTKQKNPTQHPIQSRRTCFGTYSRGKQTKNSRGKRRDIIGRPRRHLFLTSCIPPGNFSFGYQSPQAGCQPSST